MMDGLKMPDSFAGGRIEGEERVGEQVVSRPVVAVEIGSCRSGGRKNNSAFFIHRHAGPVIRGAGISPGVLRPGLVPELARTRNGVKRPYQLTGPDVVGSDVSGRRGERFRIASANN